jgi:hypothetical protein
MEGSRRGVSKRAIAYAERQRVRVDADMMLGDQNVAEGFALGDESPASKQSRYQRSKDRACGPAGQHGKLGRVRFGRRVCGGAATSG